MIDADFPLDLFMIGVIFGVAAFVWAGWAQERPPKGVIWRIVLAVVGIHFIPLGWVFGQPILVVTGVVVTVIAVVVARASERAAARSFWCGLLGGSILLVVGAVCSAVGFGALAGA